jgi:hypothetical protein
VDLPYHAGIPNQLPHQQLSSSELPNLEVLDWVVDLFKA